VSIYTPFSGSSFQPKYLETYTGEHAPQEHRDTTGDDRLLPVDRDTVEISFRELLNLDLSNGVKGVMPRSIKGDCLDAMVGPSRLSSMLSSIYLADGSRQFPIDFSNLNVVYQGYCAGNGVHSFEYEDVYGQKVAANTHDPLWTEVAESEIASIGRGVYKGVKGVDLSQFDGSFERSRMMSAGGVFGDVNELEPEQFVFGTMFYGAESATKYLYQMVHMLKRFFYSLKVGAPFIVVLSLESIGYSGGPYTWFPATFLRKEQVPALIHQFGWPITGKFFTTKHSYREGHDGVGVLIGRRIWTRSSMALAS
jgi:hypothetical protein